VYRVFEALDELGAIVEEARGVPMTAGCVVPRGDVLELIDDIKDAIPGELDDAQDVLDARDALLREAKEHSGSMVSSATTEADSLVNHARAEADRLLRAEIADCRADPALAERTDVLAMLVRATDEDGRGMTDTELRDQLMTLLLAGHETTATALSWTFERLVRHPDVLARAVRAAEDGDDEFLDAIVRESLRVRPVIFDVARKLSAPVELAGHRLPAGVTVAPAIGLVQRAARHWPDPLRFDPDRMVGAALSPTTWLPFGGGGRRCLGATFAQVEMRVVLREVLRRVELAPTTARSERQSAKHITLVPHRGARVRVNARRPAARNALEGAASVAR
jgi:cytochrome P450